MNFPRSAVYASNRSWGHPFLLPDGKPNMPVIQQAAKVAFRDPDRDPEAEPLMLNLWTAVDAYFAQHGKPCPLTGKERVT